METQPKKVYVSTPHLKRYLIINQLHFTPVAASRKRLQGYPKAARSKAHDIDI